MVPPVTDGLTKPYIHAKFNDYTFDQLAQYLLELEVDLLKSIDQSLAITTSGTYGQLYAADVKQLLLSRPHSGVEMCIRNMLLETVIRLEKKSGFAAFIAVLSCIKFSQKYIRQLSLNNKFRPAEACIEKDLMAISYASRKASKTEAIKAIRQYIKDPLASHIITNACNIVGHSGQLYIDKEYGNQTTVELTSGYTFPYGPPAEYSSGTRLNVWKEVNVKIVIIDGIIETVGEIHNMLQYFHEQKRAGIIVCRGMGEEILGTLIANKNRGTLNIIPIIVPYDLEGINSLVDIATTCSTDIVSSIKGDLISSIVHDDIATVDKVTITAGRLIISNDKALYGVRRHVQNILQQKKDADISDKKDLFDKRTKALSSTCVHIRLSTDTNHRELVLNRLHHGIKLFKEISRHGLLDLSNNIDNLNDLQTKEVLAILQNNGFEKISIFETILGLKTGVELARSITSAEVYLILDQHGG